jgi:hypothetical protein
MSEDSGISINGNCLYRLDFVHLIIKKRLEDLNNVYMVVFFMGIWVLFYFHCWKFFKTMDYWLCTCNKNQNIFEKTRQGI